MPGKNARARWQKTQEKEAYDEDRINPMLVFCLFDEVNVRQTIYDSSDIFHKELMHLIGSIALIPFNAPLSGRKIEFERLLKYKSSYLLLHSEQNFKISQKELEDFSSLIKYIKQQKRGLKIYATPIVAKVMKGRFNFVNLHDVHEISQKI